VECLHTQCTPTHIASSTELRLATLGFDGSDRRHGDLDSMSQRGSAGQPKPKSHYSKPQLEHAADATYRFARHHVPGVGGQTTSMILEDAAVDVADRDRRILRVYVLLHNCNKTIFEINVNGKVNVVL